MSDPRTTPLTPEERALAERLARLGAPSGPSPALDAGILAAAHAAVAGKIPARAPRRTQRWPVAFGAAATLALAVGIGWQLRRSSQTQQVYSEAPATARAVSGPSAAEELPIDNMDDAGSADAAMAPAMPAEKAGMQQSEAKPGVASERAASPAAVPAEGEANVSAQSAGAAPVAFPAQAPVERAVAPAPPPPPPDIVFDQLSPMDVQAPAAPAASTATGALSSEVRDKRASANEDTQAAKARGRALNRAEADESRGDAADAGDDEAFADQSLDDQPPATADSPAVKQAWLQRIRALLEAGNVAGAKASLDEFSRRYPDDALPADLRNLRE